MTAMKDAYNKAKKIRYDDTARLLNEAQALLRKYDKFAEVVHQFVKLMRSEPSLMTELAKQYLQRVPVPQEGKAGAVQGPGDIQAGGDRPVEIEEVHVIEHTRNPPGKGPRERTEREKEIARKATVASNKMLTVMQTEKILGRSLGRIRWHEYETLLTKGIEQCVNGVKLTNDSAKAVLIAGRMLQTYSNPFDRTEQTQDFASIHKVEEIVRWAEQETPRAVELVTKEYLKVFDAYRPKELTS